MPVTPAATAATLAAVRRDAPLVQMITNYVSMDVAANALLALGASPAMAHAVDEVEDFVSIASALVVNIGTLSPPWVEAMHLAAARSGELGKPWVLDPVGAGATPYRTRVARELAQLGPTVLRGNASEILAVAGAGGATRGVDSADPAEAARGSAEALARELGCVVAVTGATDYVTDGARTVSVGNGDPMMTRVTALGCSLSGVVAACCAVGDEPLAATAHALAIFGLCGEIAAEAAPGPGTLRVRLMDSLYRLDARTVERGARFGGGTREA